jgi:hypothetical protein
VCYIAVLETAYLGGGEVCTYFFLNLRAFQRNLLPSATRMQVADYSERSADFSKGTERHDSHDDTYRIQSGHKSFP